MELTTAKQQMSFIVGRIQGLAGTARYELSDEIRNELNEIARKLQEIDVN